MAKQKGKHNVKTDVNCGCLVEVSLMDGEEGFAKTMTGKVIYDYEESYYQRNVDVKLENGRTIYRVPKWLCRIVKGNGS